MATVAAGTFTASAAKKDPYDGSRIYWDLSSQKQIFPSGTYARMIQLQDGRLMAVCEKLGGGVLVSYSIDGGNSWSAAEQIVWSADKVPVAVPDLIQLSDGTIVVGYNPRPSAPYTEDRLFGIRVVRSTDNGKTWSDPIFVYDAHHTFGDGCWEPSFLELPSGELHLYFANEGPFTSSNEQEISVCRSFDGGQTWSDKDRVCFRAGSRDGMPAAIITDNNEIAVIVEDNGHPGYNNFRATTVRCSLDDNWKTWVDANSTNRNMIFSSGSNRNYISAAPYLRKLKTGETVASWQGNHDRADYSDMSYLVMFTAVGDVDAKNFKAVTQPFGIPVGQNGLWNSVSVVDDGTVFALTSWSDGHGTSVYTMKGYPMKGFEANYGTPAIDASFTKDKWTKKNAQQVFMGVRNRNRATMDFLYDDNNLYFYGRVADRTIFTDKADNDGIFLFLDLENACDVYPQTGMFRLFLNADGTIEFSSGASNKWTKAAAAPEGIDYKVKVSKTYYDMEIAIPWSVLGYDKPPVDKLMRCNIEVRDRRDTELVWETIPETYNDGKSTHSNSAVHSYLWPEFKLNAKGTDGIADIAADNAAAKAQLHVSGNVLNVSASAPVDSVKVFSVDGSLLASQTRCGDHASIDLPLTKQIVITEIQFADGSVQHDKMLIQ